MPEIANVVSGNSIASVWGNQIRDRTIQRYATAAARTAGHPTPTEGDLSYLQDVNRLEYYDGTSWRAFGGPEETDGHASISDTTTTSYATMDTAVALTIPTNWVQWSAMAWAAWTQNTVSPATYNVQFLIDGTAVNASAALPTDSSIQSHSWLGRRTGIATTGARSISLQAKHNGANPVGLTGLIYARAIRTS